MTAYVISETENLDEAAAERYRELAGASVRRHGGRYLARGAEPIVPEGDWPEQQRMVLIAFDDMDALLGWYHSEDYAEALEIRQTAIRRRLIFFEGLPGA